MTDPYRSRTWACPACNSALCEFHARLVCDHCQGIMMSLADFAGGVHDLTSLEPELTFDNEKPGTRVCPHCETPMSRCEIRIGLENKLQKPHVELDRCDAHGLWFDDAELGRVFESVAGKGYGGVVGRKQVAGGGAVDQGRWTASFKIGGLKGGW